MSSIPSDAVYWFEVLTPEVGCHVHSTHCFLSRTCRLFFHSEDLRPELLLSTSCYSPTVGVFMHLTEVQDELLHLLLSCELQEQSVFKPWHQQSVLILLVYKRATDSTYWYFTHTHTLLSKCWWSSTVSTDQQWPYCRDLAKLFPNLPKCFPWACKKLRKTF